MGIYWRGGLSGKINSMSPDMIVAIGMGLIVLIFCGMLTAKLSGTIISPLRVFHPLKVALRRLMPMGDGLVLSSAEMNDSMLLLGQGAEISGHTFSTFTNSYGSSILLISLGFPVNIHVVAIGNRPGWLDNLNAVRLRKYLSMVKLEGNYSDHISMFCSKGMELELLQLFDPADMACFMDFCKNYNFEIYKDGLYISEERKHPDNSDSTTMVKDAKQFIERNQKLLTKI